MKPVLSPCLHTLCSDYHTSEDDTKTDLRRKHTSIGFVMSLEVEGHEAKWANHERTMGNDIIVVTC